jgi:hypothetical protein
MVRLAQRLDVDQGVDPILFEVPLIIYGTNSSRPPPPGVQLITNRPDEVLSKPDQQGRGDQTLTEDLEVSPLIRLSPHTPYRAIHRFQHVVAFLAYSFATLFWVFVKDYKYFLMVDLGPYRGRKHPWSEWLRLFLEPVREVAEPGQQVSG